MVWRVRAPTWISSKVSLTPPPPGLPAGSSWGPVWVLQGLDLSWGKSWWRWSPWFSSLLSPRFSEMVQPLLPPQVPPQVLLSPVPVTLLLHLLQEFLGQLDGKMLLYLAE